MNTSEQALLTADELVEFLRSRIQDTQGQSEWTKRNLGLLYQFSQTMHAESYPSAPNAPPEAKAAQFLWDFIAYRPSVGIVLAAESEHDNNRSALEHDFEKLLYVRSPLKLMMCRIDSMEQAIEIKNWLHGSMKRTCAQFTPGEVFILYCTWWASPEGKNRDVAYVLQVGGELEYAKIVDEEFEAL